MFHWLCSSIFPCSFVRHVMVTWTLSFTVSYFHFHLQNMQKMRKQSKHSTPGSTVPLAMFPVVFCQITKFDSGYVCFDHRNNKLIDIFKFEIVHVWFEVVLNIWSRADWRIEMGFAVFYPKQHKITALAKVFVSIDTIVVYLIRKLAQGRRHLAKSTWSS